LYRVGCGISEGERNWRNRAILIEDLAIAEGSMILTVRLLPREAKALTEMFRHFRFDEVALAQVETESTIMIDVTLMPAQLVALRKHVDRTIEENLCKTDMEREELDAIQALRDAWRYRWSEPLL
jgi:aerobic-type carbon monoxide dehydrogenase small subunit (CoxS/CutS family)